MRFIFLPALFLLASCASLPKGHYDAVLDAVPYSVKKIEPGAVTDAVAGASQASIEPADAIVSFRVNRVLRGEFLAPRGGRTKLQQMGESFKNKDYLEVLNYKDPNELIPKEWISIAVKDPVKHFGLDYGDVAGGKRYKLYLLKLKGHAGSYLLTQSEVRN